MVDNVLFTGSTSRIYTEFKGCLPQRIELIGWSRNECDLSDLTEIDRRADTILNADRIVLAHGTIATERFRTRSEDDIVNSLKTNLLSYVRIIEIALEGNAQVRIAVLGSESGHKGSFDIPYALSKAALHKYVEERRIPHPAQQLVCVAPSTISDSRMTLARHDQEQVQQTMQTNPKERGVTSREVARMLHFLLFEDQGYTSNTVIPMNGGKFARM